MPERIACATRLDGFRHRVSAGGHELVVDEPVEQGGGDAGPSPTKLLAASLASCTAITMEMYADRKGWELPELEVSVEIEGSATEGDAVYTVILHLPDGLTEEQVEKLTKIAGRCPVHRALSSETSVTIVDRVAGS